MNRNQNFLNLILFLNPILFLTILGCTETEPEADWKRSNISTDADLNVIAFLDENVGFVGAEQKAPLSHSKYEFIDGSYFDYVNGVHINSDSTKYLYVEYSTANPEPVLFKTRDGGDTWSEISTPFISGVIDIFFLNEQHGFVMTREEGLYKTLDGGSTWSRTLSNIAFLGNQRIVYNPFSKIRFFNVKEGIAFHEEKGTVVRTEDGGESWSIVADFNMDCVSCGLSSFTPLNSETALAVYNGNKLVKTIDAGQTWNEMSFTISPPDQNGFTYQFNDLDFKDEEIGAMVYGGSAYKTIDGGQTWERLGVRPMHGDKVLVKEENQLLVQFHGNPSLYRLDTSNPAYDPLTAQGDAASIKDWCLAGNKALAVGANGLLLRFDGR